MKDPYKYVDVDVLINKFNIKNQNDLQRKEMEITYISLISVGKVKGNFDFEHLKAIHKYIFGSIFEWAGKERIIPIEKPEKVINGLSVEYASPSEIKKEAVKIIEKLNSTKWDIMTLDQQVKSIVEHTAALWKIHPFREGNTRTTISFISAFVKENGMRMDEELFEKNSSYFRDALVLASIGEYSETQYLEKIFRDALWKGKILQIVESPEQGYTSTCTGQDLYNVYAKKYLVLEKGIYNLQKDYDKNIIRDMIKDGRRKDDILIALKYSPDLSNLSSLDKKKEARKMYMAIIKEVDIRKYLRGNDLSI